MDSIENIITIGTLIEGKNPTDEVNGEALGDDCYRVSIYVSLNGASFLPKSKNNEMVHMGQVTSRQ